MSILQKNSHKFGAGNIKLIEKIIQNPDNTIEYNAKRLSIDDIRPDDESYEYSVKSNDGTEIVKIILTDIYRYNSETQPTPSSHSENYLLYINGENVYLDEKHIKKLYHMMSKEHSAREAHAVKTPKKRDEIKAFLGKFVRE